MRDLFGLAILILALGFLFSALKLGIHLLPILEPARTFLEIVILLIAVLVLLNLSGYF